MIGSAVELAEQLVAEVMVRDMERSLDVYVALGFVLERREHGFAALRFGGRRLFLDERRDLPPPTGGPAPANVRMLVPDVDDAWATALALGLAVERSIGDRPYGLRDFTVHDPDGFGLRFATPLASGGD